MYVHFDEGDPLKLVVLNKRLQFAATHKLGVLLGVDCAKVGRRGGEGRGGERREGREGRGGEGRGGKGKGRGGEEGGGEGREGRGGERMGGEGRGWEERGNQFNCLKVGVVIPGRGVNWQTANSF